LIALASHLLAPAHQNSSEIGICFSASVVVSKIAPARPQAPARSFAGKAKRAAEPRAPQGADLNHFTHALLLVSNRAVELMRHHCDLLSSGSDIASGMKKRFNLSGLRALLDYPVKLDYKFGGENTGRRKRRIWPKSTLTRTARTGNGAYLGRRRKGATKPGTLSRALSRN
jgi:hypothetical protein